MEAEHANIFFNLFLILTIIIIALLTTICSQIPVEISNSNIDFFSMLLPAIVKQKETLVEQPNRQMSFKSSLPQQVLDALTGSMLGDGWIGFSKRRDPNPTANACYAMTLKNHEYIMYLWSKIYSPICTSTVPRPWPNPKTGLPASQYTFQTRFLVPLTLLHKIWYSWSPELTKYVKILPLNIGELLTPIGLALWIQDDGYRNGNALVLCTECFTKSEVELLISVLRDNFGLTSNIQERKQKGRHIGWRIYIRTENRDKLISLVKPYFVPSMLYKLGL